MANDVVIQHPDFEDQKYTVSADDVDAWVEQGWKRVKRADEPEVKPGPPSGAE